MVWTLTMVVNIAFVCAVIINFANCDDTPPPIWQTLSLFNPVENFISANTPAEESSDFEEFYDFIIIGAGSGGSVLANRLTENTNWTVLLLEAGTNENFISDIPLMAAFQASTQYNWGYKNEPQPGACLGSKEQRCNAIRGKALGGTSVVNFLIYTRGNPGDYDSWAQLGNPGWSYNEILPYFIKSEDCSGCKNIDTDYHGFQGTLKIENPRLKSPLLKKFLRAGQELGYDITDPNGHQHIGFSEAQATMNRGRRCSAAKAFLSPEIRQRPNLQISTRTRVVKILFDDQKRATGVEIIKNRQKFIIKTRREVILSAGAFNSPQLLMLSGIGPGPHLKTLGIPPIQDLKVGYNLQDHISFSHLLFLVNESITVSDTLVQNPRHVLNYLLNGDGPYSIPGGALGIGFLQSGYNHFGKDYPDLELVLGAGGLNGDTMGTLRRLLRLPEETYRKVYSPVVNIPGFSIATVMLRPKSIGRVMLKDKNPLHWPAIHGNYFYESEDLDVLIEGIKKAIKLVNSEAFDLIKEDWTYY
ncbi:glucose dehydrogenase [FAD, quinone]-like [Atheta coriaria]|uniref:glucose dehydrogenase [FAD, quinone]-like n=1 Tax=Dalotia coriaria TaxID=877792 RepID=UPI0031F33A2A